jgi:hypothetical protein
MKENLENSNIENPNLSTNSIWSSLVVLELMPRIFPKFLTQIKFKIFDEILMMVMVVIYLHSIYFYWMSPIYFGNQIRDI